MKFAFIADIHLSRYGQDPVEPTSGLPERLHGILNSLSFIVDYCRKNKIKDIVIGGDILHGKSIIYALAQDVMLQLFNDCHDINFRVIAPLQNLYLCGAATHPGGGVTGINGKNAAREIIKDWQ